MIRKSTLRKLVSVGFPFLLPLAVLATWIVTQSRGQVNDPVQILASIDPSGDGTAYLSTIVPDGTQAVWRCSSGTFLESGDQDATGRSVTWKAESGFTDSVTVWMTTPTMADSISFLPVIREVTPTITVSSAYNLAVLDRSRSVSIPVGAYMVVAADEGLDGYDGLTVLISHSPGGVRQGWVLFPGDTLKVNLPLGAVFEAVGLDDLESALDNSGAVLLRFNREGGSVSGILTPETVPDQPEPLPDHQEENADFVEDYII
ncbi:MAG: hypothetical protein R6V62_05835 [Candidatus Fermentibacteraceae bacterium]